MERTVEADLPRHRPDFIPAGQEPPGYGREVRQDYLPAGLVVRPLTPPEPDLKQPWAESREAPLLDHDFIPNIPLEDTDGEPVPPIAGLTTADPETLPRAEEEEDLMPKDYIPPGVEPPPVPPPVKIDYIPAEPEVEEEEMTLRARVATRRAGPEEDPAKRDPRRPPPAPPTEEEEAEEEEGRRVPRFPRRPGDPEPKPTPMPAKDPQRRT